MLRRKVITFLPPPPLVRYWYYISVILDGNSEPVAYLAVTLDIAGHCGLHLLLRAVPGREDGAHQEMVPV